MRTSKTVSITLPYGMIARATELAKIENRTMSELIREALRQYDRQQQWTKIRAYGAESAARLDLKEEDIMPLVKQVRTQLLKPRRRKPAKRPKR